MLVEQSESALFDIERELIDDRDFSAVRFRQLEGGLHTELVTRVEHVLTAIALQTVVRELVRVIRVRDLLDQDENIHSAGVFTRISGFQRISPGNPAPRTKAGARA